MSGIFLRQGDELVEMAEQPYELENRLQELLARHPNLLAGDQIDPESPRRWLLVARELALASDEAGAGRWSVDHLFLDQDGVPTIVEVKRGADTRIRREVVGQMLEYAANAVTYWQVDALRTSFETSAQRDGREPQEELVRLLDDPNADADQFWEHVKTNLQAGRLRLVFVSDSIPTELQRMVEFLNERMTPTEVIAVEIKQYVGDGHETLVPRVVGQTAQARQRKSRGQKRSSWREPLEALGLHRAAPTPPLAGQQSSCRRGLTPEDRRWAGRSVG
jgi:hypothetical protein